MSFTHYTHKQLPDRLNKIEAYDSVRKKEKIFCVDAQVKNAANVRSTITQKKRPRNNGERLKSPRLQVYSHHCRKMCFECGWSWLCKWHAEQTPA